MKANISLHKSYRRVVMFLQLSAEHEMIAMAGS